MQKNMFIQLNQVNFEHFSCLSPRSINEIDTGSFAHHSSLLVHPFSELVSCTQQKKLSNSLRISLPQSSLTKQPTYHTLQNLQKVT